MKPEPPLMLLKDLKERLAAANKLSASLRAMPVYLSEVLGFDAGFALGQYIGELEIAIAALEDQSDSTFPEYDAPKPEKVEVSFVTSEGTRTLVGQWGSQ